MKQIDNKISNLKNISAYTASANSLGSTAKQNDIIDKLTGFLNKYRLFVNVESKCLSRIWLLELHKSPTKDLFI